MPDTHPKHAWKILEVETLVGLPRRDIQRACYEGEGGVGLLNPANSTWGRRTYGCEDLAKLFVASELRREGLSLPEIKREVDEALAQGVAWSELLGSRAHRLREQEEDLRGRRLKAEVLLAALTGSESGANDAGHLVEERLATCAAGTVPPGQVREAQQSLLARLVELRECMEQGVAPGEAPAQAALATRAETCDAAPSGERAWAAFVEAALGEPGMDLALDVWLGSGTYAYAACAWDAWLIGREERPQK